VKKNRRLDACAGVTGVCEGLSRTCMNGMAWRYVACRKPRIEVHEWWNSVRAGRYFVQVACCCAKGNTFKLACHHSNCFCRLAAISERLVPEVS